MSLDEGSLASAPQEEAATLGHLSAHLLLHALCLPKVWLALINVAVP